MALFKKVCIAAFFVLSVSAIAFVFSGCSAFSGSTQQPPTGAPAAKEETAVDELSREEPAKTQIILSAEGFQPGLWQESYEELLSEGVDDAPFFLYDMDKNGIPELFYKADAFWRVYTTASNGMEELPHEDEFLYLGNSSYAYDNNADGLRGILCHEADGDGSSFYIVYLENGIIKTKNIYKIPPSSGDELPEYIWCEVSHFQDGREIPGARPHLAEFEGDAVGGLNVPRSEITALTKDFFSGERLALLRPQ